MTAGGELKKDPRRCGQLHDFAPSDSDLSKLTMMHYLSTALRQMPIASMAEQKAE